MMRLRICLERKSLRENLRASMNARYLISSCYSYFFLKKTYPSCCIYPTIVTSSSYRGFMLFVHFLGFLLFIPFM
jgi:hypothetical protein